MEYLIFKVKIDKRYKKGYVPSSFHYVGEAEDYETAKETVKQHKQSGYAVGIETITRY